MSDKPIGDPRKQAIIDFTLNALGDDPAVLEAMSPEAVDTVLDAMGIDTTPVYEKFLRRLQDDR